MAVAPFNYQRYLASREWGLLKTAVRERSRGLCERCSAGKELEDADARRMQQVHHLTYERIGNELLEDLLGVCRTCHAWLNGASNEDPYRDYLLAYLDGEAGYLRAHPDGHPLNPKIAQEDEEIAARIRAGADAFVAMWGPYHQPS